MAARIVVRVEGFEDPFFLKVDIEGFEEPILGFKKMGIFDKEVSMSVDVDGREIKAKTYPR